MATKLIQFNDGTMIEVAASRDEYRELSGASAKSVDGSLSKIEPLLKNICAPLKSAMENLKQNLKVDNLEVEIGFNFEGEGNLYIAKSKAGASLKVKLTIAGLDSKI